MEYLSSLAERWATRPEPGVVFAGLRILLHARVLEAAGAGGAELFAVGEEGGVAAGDYSPRGVGQEAR